LRRWPAGRDSRCAGSNRASGPGYRHHAALYVMSGKTLCRVSHRLTTRGRFGIELDRSLRQIAPGKSVVSMMKTAKFAIGQVVRHRLFPFRGIIFDVDPQFANTDEWYEAIPADVRPRKDQPFYHLLAENSETEYIAYVSEQNLLEDQSGEPIRHPRTSEMFDKQPDGRYEPKRLWAH
jgi:heat shock protein HspQ